MEFGKYVTPINNTKKIEIDTNKRLLRVGALKECTNEDSNNKIIPIFRG